jgi:hypothetical protein
MMTPEEEALIREFNSGFSADVHISLLITEDQRSKEFQNFCDGLVRLAPRIRVSVDEGEPDGAPAIQIGNTLRYHAVPLGRELGPFLDALPISDGRTSSIPASVQDNLKKLNLPAMLRLFISQQCPFCPMTVQNMIPLLDISELIHLTVIDCTLFPEMAQSNEIQSVPTLLLDKQFRWTGSFLLEEVTEVMSNRDPAKLGSPSLERMLKEGNAAKLAEMILEREEIFPSLLDLLTHHKWPVRLGAMVVMEEVTSRNIGLASQVIDPLWERFKHVEDPVKGDIIHILGELRSHTTAQRLQTVLHGEYDAEVKEAAREALEKMEISG